MFNSVWNEPLLAELPSFGIPPPLRDFVSSRLCGRNFVVDGGSTFNSCRGNCRVFQESVLPPSCLMLYFNHLLDSTSNTVFCSADDFTLNLPLDNYDVRPSPDSHLKSLVYYKLAH